MDMETLVKAMGTLGVAFNREITRELIGIYWTALSDLPDERFKVAVNSAVRDCKFFPSAGELRERAKVNRTPSPEDTVRALEAMKPDWSKVPDLEQLKALREEVGK
jgi:hypothetical protein